MWNPTASPRQESLLYLWQHLKRETNLAFPMGVSEMPQAVRFKLHSRQPCSVAKPKQALNEVAGDQ